MRNFLKIAENVDVVPVVHALAQMPDVWNRFTLRTEHPGTAHSEVDDILVWFNDLTSPDTVINDKDVVPFPAWSAIPQLRPIIFDLMRRVEGVRLGRVIISRLAPGRQIYPHVDGGAPAEYYSRYQVALQSLPGCIFTAGDETVTFRTGDVWMFDNTKQHSVTNNSADDRLALIVDIRTA